MFADFSDKIVAFSKIIYGHIFARKNCCKNNLGQIGLANLNFDVYWTQTDRQSKCI